jgi:hypothetical protein
MGVELYSSSSWVDTQHKTFTSWVNHILNSSEQQQQQQQQIYLSDLIHGFTNGVNLVLLVRQLTKKYEEILLIEQPTSRIQYLTNVNSALAALKQDNIELINIDAIDIVDGNLKLILGLVWRCIMKYQVLLNNSDTDADNSTDNVLFESEIVNWVNDHLRERKLDNLTFDLQDGYALFELVRNLTGLVAPYHPIVTEKKHDSNHIQVHVYEGDKSQINVDLRVSSDQLVVEQPIDRVRLALQTAFEVFRTPILMDEHDIVERPDRLSIVTYLSLFKQKVNERFGGAEHHNMSLVSLDLSEYLSTDERELARQELPDELFAETSKLYTLPPVPASVLQQQQQQTRKLPPPPSHLVNNNNNNSRSPSSPSSHYTRTPYSNARREEGTYTYTAKVMLNHYSNILKGKIQKSLSDPSLIRDQ